MAILLVLLLSVYLIGVSTAEEDCTQTVCKLNDTSIRFLIIGDWGGSFYPPYVTQGQSLVASTMGIIAKQWKTHFQLGLGDNFYLVGVKSVHDPRFRTTFEEAYSAPSLQTPWYHMLGNHDYFGNPSAQIAYTQKSSRWNMPNHYYSVRYQLPDSTRLTIIVLDTVILCGTDKNISYARDSGDWFTSPQIKLGQPKNQSEAQMQLNWLEEELNKTKEEGGYIFVAGHYPIYSVNHDGSEECLKPSLLPLLQKYKVHAYLSGHDHNLQHIKFTKNKYVGHQIISGAAAYMDYGRENAKKLPKEWLRYEFPGEQPSCTGWFCGENNFNLLAATGFIKGGFVTCALDAKEAVFSFYRGDGKPLYAFSMLP